MRFSDSQGDFISPWHHIPLRVQTLPLLNFVVEIPKGCVVWSPLWWRFCVLLAVLVLGVVEMALCVVLPRKGSERRVRCEACGGGVRTRSTRIKYEIATREPLNPLKPDLTKSREVRYVGAASVHRVASRSPSRSHRAVPVAVTCCREQTVSLREPGELRCAATNMGGSRGCGRRS